VTADPQPWSTVTLEHTSGELVTITCTAASADAFYGVPFASDRDNRVVFPRPEWEVVPDGD
jgi:hypothetical protein